MPNRLHEAASSVPSVADAALDWIWDNVIHQGTRWQSTAVTIPFLFELLKDQATRQRHAIAWGVQHLAVDEIVPLFPNGLDLGSVFQGADQIALDPTDIREIWNAEDWDTLTDHQRWVADQMPLRWHYDAYRAVEQE
jgi:hypothetical protein